MKKDVELESVEWNSDDDASHHVAFFERWIVGTLAGMFVVTLPARCGDGFVGVNGGEVSAAADDLFLVEVFRWVFSDVLQTFDFRPFRLILRIQRPLRLQGVSEAGCRIVADQLGPHPKHMSGKRNRVILILPVFAGLDGSILLLQPSNDLLRVNGPVSHHHGVDRVRKLLR